MSAEANKAMVRRYIEVVWNRPNIDAVDELVSSDYLNHVASAEYQARLRRGQAPTKLALRRLPRPPFRHRGGRRGRGTVAVRGTCSGTHEGELWGIPPTGERFGAQQSHWFRVDDGKVAEHWAVRDDLGMIRQLGIAPA